MIRQAALILGLSLLCRGASWGEARRPMIVVSVLPQADIVRQLAGQLVEVQVLIPPGAGEAFEPTMEQARAIAKAELYIKVGHPAFLFEKAYLQRLASQNPALRIVDGSAGLPPAELDPHVWVAPSRVRILAINAEAALEELLPEQKEALRANLAGFQERLRRLDAEIHAQLDPYRGRKFLVFHPAWGHFAQDYGLVQLSISEEEKEPSMKQLEELIRQAKAEGLRVVFSQPQYSSQYVDLVARELGGRVVSLDPLAADWFQNMEQVAAALRASFQP